MSFIAFLDPGSGIRDPESGMGKNQDPESGINIPDPPHWIRKTRNQIVRENMQSHVLVFLSVYSYFVNAL
jgi:hypothetical protein